MIWAVIALAYIWGSVAIICSRNLDMTELTRMWAKITWSDFFSSLLWPLYPIIWFFLRCTY